MCKYRETILVIDDNDLFREQLRMALGGIDCRVHAFADLDAAEGDLRTGFSPSVVFADRWIEDEPSEQRLLGEIKEVCPDSLVVIYTRIDELTKAQQRQILSLGAVRVLDTREVADSADNLLREFRELRELSGALKELTEGRSKLVTALVGTDVGVTMIDRQNICWFANDKQREFVCNECRAGLCWCLFHGRPAACGPCWGCGVRDIFEEVVAKGRTVQRTILTRVRGNKVKWLSVHTKPICDSKDQRIIAATEAVSELDEGYVNNMEPSERLFAVARGLVHAGFGRVRVYRLHGDKKTQSLIAAASCKDGFETRGYFEGLCHFRADYTICPYSQTAYGSRNGIGTIVDKWDKALSPFSEVLELELPYLLVPIRDRSGKKIGLIAVDFVGLEENAKTEAIGHLAKCDTLNWIRDGYCREAAQALVGFPTSTRPASSEAFARQDAALRARQRMGAASSLDEAIDALRQGFKEIGPDCEFFVRRKQGNRLITEVVLDVPEGLNRREETPLDDDSSLSAYVLSQHGRPLWIDDYADWCSRAVVHHGPTGTCEANVASVARIPLRFEATDYGVLAVESTNAHRWKEEGFADPLTELAEHAALLLRDLAIRDDLEAARKRVEGAERIQREAEVAKLRTVASIAGHLPLPIFVKSKDHHFLYVNEAYCRDVGRSKTEIMGKLDDHSDGLTDLELHGAKLAAFFQKTDDEIVRTGELYENSAEPHPVSDDETREVHVIKTPFRSPTGEIAGVMGVLWDVTKEQQAVRQLQAWRDGFVQSANAIVYACDLSGRISFANQAAAGSLGFATGELEGMNMCDFVVPEERDEFGAFLVKLRPTLDASANEGVREFRVRARDGRVLSWEIAQSQCDIAPSKPGILAVVHDVTERNQAREQAEHELEKARALRSLATGFGRAGQLSTLHRLFMLAVTHGECLGFSRAILFLPTSEPDCFVAALAIGTTTLAAARERWKEARKTTFDEAIRQCLRAADTVRAGDLQSVVGALSLKLDEEPALMANLRGGKPVIRRLRGASQIQSPHFAAATRTDTNEDVEFIVSPLNQDDKLEAILWADRAFLDDPVVPDGVAQRIDILWTEMAVTSKALGMRAREEAIRTKAAQAIARGMSYSLFTRAAGLDFDLSLLKWKLGDEHADAIEEMAKSIEFFKHASALTTKDLQFAESGVCEPELLDFNEIVRDVIQQRQNGTIKVKLAESSLLVLVNKTQAEDIVVEILANALDFADKDSPVIEVTTTDDFGHARLDISDNGKGVHPSIRPGMFKRFKRYPEGRLGMGLAYVEGLVHAYGGKIEEVGKAGGGAHFVVKLPLGEEGVEDHGK